MENYIVNIFTPEYIKVNDSNKLDFSNEIFQNKFINF